MLLDRPLVPLCIEASYLSSCSTPIPRIPTRQERISDLSFREQLRECQETVGVGSDESGSSQSPEEPGPIH